MWLFNLCDKYLYLLHRFEHLFSDMDCILASAKHPNYWLSRWLEWLPDINAVGLRKTATNHLSRLLENNNVESSSSETEKASDNEADGLLGALREDVENECRMDLLLKTFLPAKPNKGPLTVDALPHKSFRDLFLRFNTQIPSSAAVERMFSMGKNLLKGGESSSQFLWFTIAKIEL